MIHHREEKWPERRKMLHEFEHTCTKFSHIGKKYIYIYILSRLQHTLSLQANSV